MSKKHQIIVIGAGTGGLTVSGALLKKDPNLDIAIIDPSSTHYYHPAWTLVGAGSYKMKKTEKPTKDLIPKGAKWYKNSVVEIDPDQNKIVLDNGEELLYDYLVASPGIQLNIDGIEGLRAALETPYVCSNYINPEQQFANKLLWWWRD